MSNEGGSEYDECANVNTSKSSHKTDFEEDDSWISGEELNTEESTDEEDLKFKSQPKKQTCKPKGKTTLHKRNDRQASDNPKSSAKSEQTSVELLKESDDVVGADVDWKEDAFVDTPSWRPKRGSIKLSDLEGYHLTQMLEKDPSNSSLSDSPVTSGNDVFWSEEDELFSDVSLKFLKDIHLNDLNEILQKYLKSDPNELPEICPKSNYQDAKNLGGIYADFVRRDPSLNDPLIKMNNLDNILNEKTLAAEKFLNPEKQNGDNPMVDIPKRICKKPGKISKAIRPATHVNIRKSVKSRFRMVKSADNSFEDTRDENQNPTTLTEEEQERIEQLLENVTGNVEDDVEVRCGEGYLITDEDRITLNDLDSKLRLISEEKLPRKQVDDPVAIQEQEIEFLKKCEMFQENELLKEINEKLETLLRNKNKKEKPLPPAELDKLLQLMITVEGENSAPEETVTSTTDWTALFENFEPIRPTSTPLSVSNECLKCESPKQTENIT